MGTYVYSRELGNDDRHTDVNFSIEVFKESNTEYRPILTASDEDYCSGFSKRRSFKSETEAKEFYQDNEDALKREALESLLKERRKQA
jgi:hypothetical protein